MSNTLPGQLLTVYVLATVLAALGGAWLARRYRAALLPLMRAPLEAAVGAGAMRPAEVATAVPPWCEPAALTLAGHRASQARLVALLIGLSMLIALTRGALWLWLNRDDGTPFSASRLPSRPHDQRHIRPSAGSSGQA